MENTTADMPTDPKKESKRLRRLHEYTVLDSPREYSFDNLAELTANIFDIPIVLIGFIDENREWYKASIGVEFTDLNRDESFSEYILAENQTIVIEDVQDDPRVKNKQLVKGDDSVRSYLGTPLRAKDGFIIGSLSVMGHTPRTFAEIEKEILQQIAKEIMTQLDLRYLNENRRQLNQLLREELEDHEDKLHQKNLEHRELLHRTKNHFGRIKSLLSMQKTQSDENHQALELAETRLHAFISIYEQLSQTKDSSTLLSSEYLEEIIENTITLFKEKESSAEINWDLDEAELTNDIALKFGLSLSELMTNAFQHVFSTTPGDTLNITFEVNEDTYCLQAIDNGPGLSERQGSITPYENGLNIIEALIEHDSKGTFDYEFSDGAHFTITLPKTS